MNPYSQLVNQVRKQAAEVKGYDMVRATVTSASPLKIKIGEVEIGTNIYCNPALTLGLNPQSISTDEGALKQCLNSFYSAFKLNAGDTVFVQQIWDPNVKQDLFFVISKAVKL